MRAFLPGEHHVTTREGARDISTVLSSVPRRRIGIDLV
jgi:hypothetical protein